YQFAKDLPLPEGGGAVSDNDGILSTDAKDALDEKIESLCQNLAIPSKSSDGVEEAVPVQIAIAVVEGLDTRKATDDSDVDMIVERFARDLHDAWGIGYQSQKGGTGVLIFLDVHDRVIFISRGGALDKILTDSRVDTVIRDISSSMKQAKYHSGLSEAIDRIVSFVEAGEPNFWERILYFFHPENFFVVFWVFLAVNGFYRAWKQQREQREYAQLASQLSELDRAQAEALQGNYQPQTSCPICLESFDSGTLGSDGQPIKLLRCGHIFDESCWSEWVSSGRGDVTKCPVCRMDVATSPAAPAPSASDHRTENATTVAESVPTTAPTDDGIGVEGREPSDQFEELSLVQRQVVSMRGGAQ
ncbi:MAG: hypothetical protein SGILL_008514, partial [Bacillariaceae sp.]